MKYKLKIFPYKLGSESAKMLAQGLGVKRVRPTYDARRRDVIINWGNSSPPKFKPYHTDLNKRSAIALACNKIHTFNTLSTAGFEHLPTWTESEYIARDWLHEGNTVYCRTTVTGHSGNGIVVATDATQFVRAPLYTLATKHKHEFRVHVFKGKVIDVQQKKRRLGYSGPSTGIRNHSNGYIYARVDIDVPDLLLSSSISAVNLLGLDFGAVDIGYRERDGKVFVFEINTAPGLYGTTLVNYVNAFKEYLNDL